MIESPIHITGYSREPLPNVLTMISRRAENAQQPRQSAERSKEIVVSSLDKNNSLRPSTAN